MYLTRLTPLLRYCAVIQCYERNGNLFIVQAKYRIKKVIQFFLSFLTSLKG